MQKNQSPLLSHYTQKPPIEMEKMFVAFILILVPCLIQATSVKVVRNKRQSSASNVALETAVVELERQSQLTDSQFVFDFLNSMVGISNGTGGRTVAATVR